MKNGRLMKFLQSIINKAISAIRTTHFLHYHLSRRMCGLRHRDSSRCKRQLGRAESAEEVNDEGDGVYVPGLSARALTPAKRVARARRAVESLNIMVYEEKS